MIQINTNNFINKNIIKRNKSLFFDDISMNYEKLKIEIKDKKILVIGGAGTIGSNFIKSILPFKPNSIIVVDTNENGLTELVRDIRSTEKLFVPENFITYPVDFGNSIFENIFNFYKPFDIVANFAAHKHVRSEKDIFSIKAMVQNNLVYAHKLLKLLEKDKPKHFFCVSTDKAANPVNLMGASKKMMENLILQYSSIFKCTSARFANVAFSNGSLLDGFFFRLRNEQPLSVPCDVKRYFVSPQESGEICMLACILGNSGDVFFPKLNEDQLIYFKEIAKAFLNELGFEMVDLKSEKEAKNFKISKEKKQYPVYLFNSKTSGEKLFEEFFTSSEIIFFEKHLSLGVINNSPIINGKECDSFISQLHDLFERNDICKKDIVNLFQKFIPNFDHIEKGITLDKVM